MDFTIHEIPAHLLLKIGDYFYKRGQIQNAVATYRIALSVQPGMAEAVSRIGIAQKGPIGLVANELQCFLEEKYPGLHVFVGEGLATWNRTTGFAKDKRFCELAEQHESLLPLVNWHWHLNTVVWALRSTQHVDGDLVELGVFKGHTTSFVAAYLDFGSWKKKWFLYDTFAGIPEEQLNTGWETVNETTYDGTYSYEEVRDRFAKYENIEVIRGRVPEILSEQCPEKISFLHLDLNSAIAEIAALEIVFDRIQPGGVIVFDDFGWPSAKEQYAAETQWTKERGYDILELPTGQGLLIKK